VAEFYQNEAKKLGEQFFLEDQFKGLEFLPKDSSQGKDYFEDLQFAQLYAYLNRSQIADTIRRALNATAIEMYESIHNFIDKDGIVRKGATPAHENQDVIIPFNMRDGIALCKGLGNSAFNESAPHGAGRILSRSKAKNTLNTERFVQEMKDAGVFTTSASQDTLDESPEAYKDTQTILDAIAPTVRVERMIKPIYNLKAGGE
jgi:RNA-splicing ligase RtcB